MYTSDALSLVALLFSVLALVASIVLTVVLKQMDWGVDKHKRAADQASKYSTDTGHRTLARLYREARRAANAAAAAAPAEPLHAAPAAPAASTVILTTAEDFSQAHAQLQQMSSAPGTLPSAAEHQHVSDSFNRDYAPFYSQLKAALSAPEEHVELIGLIDDLLTLNGFWDETVYLHRTKQLPDDFFDPANVWLQRAMNYMRVAELYDIANWEGPMRRPNGTYLACRQARYRHLEQECFMRKGKALVPSFAVAMCEERLRKEQQQEQQQQQQTKQQQKQQHSMLADELDAGTIAAGPRQPGLAACTGSGTPDSIGLDEPAAGSVQVVVK